MQKKKVGFRRRLGAVLLALFLGTVVSVVAATPAMATTSTITCGSYGATPSFNCDSFSGFTGQRPWSYPVDSNGHNCTNYVTYRLSQAGVSNPGNLHNADDWDNYALSYGIPVNNIPTVGSVAQWELNSPPSLPASQGGSGHVAYVDDVYPDGSISTSEDNYGGTTMTRHLYPGSNWPDHFIHFSNTTVTPTSARSLTGDKFADLYWYEAWNNGTGKVVKTNSSGNGTVSASGWTTGWTTPPTWAGLGDFNGDGKTDLAWYDASLNGGTMKIELSNGSGFSSEVVWFTGWSNPTRIFVGDFDGDGRADIGWYDASVNGGTMRVIQTITNGTTVASGPSTVWFTGWSTPQWAEVGDFTGDGLTDLAWMYNGSLTVIATNKDANGNIGSGAAYPWFSGWAPPTKAVVGDFNGDGRADLAWYEGSVNGGTLFVIETAKYPAAPASGQADVWFTGWSTPTRLFAGDFTGDGNADIGWYDASVNGGVMNVIATNKDANGNIGSGAAYPWFSGWSNADFAAVG